MQEKVASDVGYGAIGGAASAAFSPDFIKAIDPTGANLSSGQQAALADVRFIQAMLGHADIKTTQVYTRVSIRALTDIHSATHPARLTRATLKPEEAPTTVADLLDALDALDAEAQAEGETEK